MSKKLRKVRLFEGLPVIDGKKAIDLHVLPIDVKGAKQKDPGQCAAAKAGQRELGTEVRVFLSRTYVKGKGHWVRYITPQAAQREIISFDRGSTFVPGTYTVTAPTKAEQLGHYRGVSTRNAEASGKPRRTHHTTGFIRDRGRYDAKLSGR